MRSSTRRALVLSAFAASAVAWSGCEAKKQTEYVAGVSTQVQVPRDLKAIRIDVSVGGVVQFCRGYRVYDGKVQLPRSLGQFPSQGTPGPDPLTVTVSGFTEEFSESTGRGVFDNCTSVAPKVGDPSQGTRILRRSRQPYVADEILFLPMPLKYSCFDVEDCVDESRTCKGGTCVDAKVDETKLPKFSEDLLDGTGGACFKASQCFAAAAPAVVVNPDDCTYALPNTPSAPPQVEGAPPNPFPKTGDGVNVEITYDGGMVREILDKDEVEGFLIPDPAKPQQFRLAPGLCHYVKGYGAPVTAANPEGKWPHRITAVRVSGTCQAKSPFQPLCASDQLASMGVDSSGVSGNANPPSACRALELTPPKAALIVLADDTKNSSLFYAQAPDQTIGLPLSDPAFSKTEIGLSFFPGEGSCTTNGSFALAEQPDLARIVQPKVKTAFASRSANDGALLKPLDAPVNLDGALRDAYAFLGQPKYSSYYRRAVLVLGNRGFDQPTCGQTPAQRATAVRAANKIETYVLMPSRNSAIVDPNVAVPGSSELAVAGGSPGAYDARSSKGAAQDAFQNVVNDLATCVYDVPNAADRPKAGDILTYSDPINPAAPTVSLPFNAACSTESVGGAGFGLDPTDPRRVYLCKASCDAYRNVLRDASRYAALTFQSAIAVPVFAHKPGCEPKGDGTGTGATPKP
jgi:hypothetical protein